MRRLHQLSLKCKLFTVATLVAVSLAAVATVSFWGYSRLEQGLDALYAQRLPSYRFAAALEANVRTLHGLVNQSMVYAILGYHAAEIQRVDAAIEQTSAETESALLRLHDTATDAADDQAVEAIRASVGKFLQAIRDTVELRPTGVGNAATFLTTAQRQYETSLRLISDMRKRKLDLAGQDVAASRSSVANAKRAIVAATVVAAAAALLLTLAITRGTLRSIQAVLRATHQMRSGDLSARTGFKPTSEELSQVGVAFDEMAQALEQRDAELKAAHEQLRNDAITDSLTGLCNRRFLNEVLPPALAGAARRRSTLAVVMLDIDHFKHVNDTFGHDAGDIVLREVAALAKKWTRRGDIACRFGGEELVLMLVDASLDGAYSVAERIRGDIASLRLWRGNVALDPITASFGVAVYPVHANDAIGLVSAADAALYRAKQTGRNRTVLAAIEAAMPVAALADGARPAETLPEAALR